MYIYPVYRNQTGKRTNYSGKFDIIKEHKLSDKMQIWEVKLAKIVKFTNISTGHQFNTDQAQLIIRK